jgi:N-acylneuraminate cytidylyltransferase/CMP-N,N'-diacetyllegionaminic acid synthase
MRNKPKVLATICARGGSKGVVGKNIRKLLGKPLIQYTLECALNSSMIDEIVISTDSDMILEVVKELGYFTDYKRPSILAKDTSAKIDAIKHVVAHVEETKGFIPDIIVDLDIGVPMRTVDDIESAILKLWNSPDMEALVTVYPSERNPYFNMIEKKTNNFYSLVKTPNPVVVRRQDAPNVFCITPAIFAWRRNTLNITHLYEGKWGIHEMPIERSIDIDTEFEFDLVEFLMLKCKV